MQTRGSCNKACANKAGALGYFCLLSVEPLAPLRCAVVVAELGRIQGSSPTQTWQVRAKARGHTWDSVTIEEEGVIVKEGGGA